MGCVGPATRCFLPDCPLGNSPPDCQPGQLQGASWHEPLWPGAPAAVQELDALGEGPIAYEDLSKLPYTGGTVRVCVGVGMRGGGRRRRLCRLSSLPSARMPANVHRSPLTPWHARPRWPCPRRGLLPGGHAHVPARVRPAGAGEAAPVALRAKLGAVTSKAKGWEAPSTLTRLGCAAGRLCAVPASTGWVRGQAPPVVHPRLNKPAPSCRRACPPARPPTLCCLQRTGAAAARGRAAPSSTSQARPPPTHLGHFHNRVSASMQRDGRTCS